MFNDIPATFFKIIKLVIGNQTKVYPITTQIFRSKVICYTFSRSRYTIADQFSTITITNKKKKTKNISSSRTLLYFLISIS